MSEAIQLDDYIDETRADSYPTRKVARKSGGSGGDMDDVLKRLGAVESSVGELRIQASGIAATMVTKDEHNELSGRVAAIAATMVTKDEHNELSGRVAAIAATMVTKDEHNELRVQVSGILGMLPSFATKADLAEIKGQVTSIVAMLPSFATKADLFAMETKIIKWIIATVLTTAGLVFTIAKFVH